LVDRRRAVAIALVVALLLLVTISPLLLAILQTPGSLPVLEKSGNWGWTQSALSADGRFFAVNTDGELILYGLHGGSVEWTFEHGLYPGAVAFSRSGNYLVAISRSAPYKWGMVYLFETDNPNPVWSWELSRSKAGLGKLLDLSDDGGRFVVGTTGGSSSGEYDPPRVYIFSRDDREPLVEFTPYGRLVAVAISPEGELVVAGTGEGYVYQFRNDSLSPVFTYDTRSNEDVTGAILSVELSVDNRMVIAGTNRGQVLFLDPTSPDPLSTYGYATVGGPVVDMRVARETSLVFVASADDNVYVFDLNSSDIRQPVSKMSTAITNKLVRVSDDGAFFLSTDLYAGGTAVLWDVNSNVSLVRFDWNSIHSIDITPDGKLFSLSKIDRVAVYRTV
jgi:hypothetical protein